MRGVPPRAPRLKAPFLRGVPPRAPRLKAPLLLVVCDLPHRVVAPCQEPKIPRSYTRIFRLDGALVDTDHVGQRPPDLVVDHEIGNAVEWGFLPVEYHELGTESFRIFGKPRRRIDDEG